jgi:hypothetical protein
VRRAGFKVPKFHDFKVEERDQFESSGGPFKPAFGLSGALMWAVEFVFDLAFTLKL